MSVSPTDRPEQGQFTPRVELRLFLELLGVYALAVAQPILAVFGSSPETFVQLGAGRGVVVAYALIVVFVPPAFLWGVEALLRRYRHEWARWLHVGLIGLGVGVFTLQILTDSLGLALGLGLLLAVLATIGACVGYGKVAAVRTWTAFLAPAAVLFAALFLFASPVSDLVLPKSVDLADVEPTGEIPVVLIVFDEFPTLTLMDADGMIDRALFPSFAELSDDATWYRNATTVHTLTHMAVPAILTGQIPPKNQTAPTPSVYSESIFTLLGADYAVNSLQAFSICPGTVCVQQDGTGNSPLAALGDLLEQSVDIYAERLTTDPGREDVDTAVGGPAAGRNGMVEHDNEYREFVGDIDARRTLSAIHLEEPHHFWVFNPSGSVSNTLYEEDHPIQTGGWDSDEAASVGRQQHSLQAMYADDYLGAVVEQLKSLDAYEDALIIVTADHGISFEEGAPRRLSSEESIPEVAWVPLFVKLPGQTDGTVTDANALTVDVVPTIADVVGVDIPWEVDGISLASDIREGNTKPFLPYVDDPEDFFPFGEPLNGDAPFAELLARARERFATPVVPTWRPFARGPYGAIVGSPVADLTVGDPVDTKGEWDDDPDARPVADDADDEGVVEIVPTWAAGSVPESVGPDPQLAFVMGNRVVATGSTFDIEDGRYPFQTRIPEEALGDGDMTVYLLSGDAEAPTLREIPFNGYPYAD